jgi:hypothetical protein
MKIRIPHKQNANKIHIVLVKNNHSQGTELILVQIYKDKYKNKYKNRNKNRNRNTSTVILIENKSYLTAVETALRIK